MGYVESLHAKAIDLSRLSVEMTAAADSGHPTSASSLAHIVAALMYGHMRYDPSDPASPTADRLVLSEGHACPIVYAAGSELGLAVGRSSESRRAMTIEDAMRLRDIGSEIDGHPNPAEGFPFFPAATGSLGQGLSIATGLAAAARLDCSDKRVFCIIGDGESREGQVWEAVDFIVDYGLNSVCPIFNCNGFGQSDPVSSQQSPEVIAAKLRGGGFDVAVIDGHDPVAVRDALLEHVRHAEDADARPFAIVAETVKGWGFVKTAGKGLHGKPLTGDDEAAALKELEETAASLGASGVNGDLKVGPTPAMASPSAGCDSPPGFVEAMNTYGQSGALSDGKFAPRKGYGIALRALGHTNPDIVALDGDVKNSTFAEYFSQDPDLAHRFFECRIAEQHLISCAAGLASGGKIPFASSFGKFVARGYDQFEMGFISRLNIKVVGSHVGVNIAADGPSQMALSDVAFFRSMAKVHADEGGPGLYILNPSDAVSAYALTVQMAEHKGACYLRAARPDTPFLYDLDADFTLGGHGVLAEGSDVLIAASGYAVHETLKAIAALSDEGIEAGLIDLYSLPFDSEAIAHAAQASGGKVVTVEDNYGAGFGSEVAESLLEHGGNFKINQMYVKRIPKSGRSADDLMNYVGLSADHIIATVRGLVG
ncbi:MAG: transketolase [Chloroflexi bacterium]|nr:transketolase [Chloroflexota bacterium]